MNATLNAGQNNQLQQADLLGEIVTWDTHSSEINIEDIRDSLVNAGLSEDVARDLNNSSAFSRATKHLKENRSIDKVKDTKDSKVIFQLTQKKVENDRVEFDYEAWVTLDKINGDITSSDPHIEAEARKLFAHAMQVRTAVDITRMVQKLFKDNADLFPINPRKGVAYFVPLQHRPFTEKVETFLKDVNGEVLRFPVPAGTNEGNRSVQEAVASGLQAMLDELSELTENWDEKTQTTTKTNAVRRYKVLEHKYQAYAEYLAGKSTEAFDNLKGAKQKLIDKITSLDAKAKPASDDDTVDEPSNATAV